MDELILTDNGKKVLHFMQIHDKVLIGKEIGELTGVKGVYSVLDSLKKRGLVIDGPAQVKDAINAKGDSIQKNYCTYILTDLGRNISIK